MAEFRLIPYSIRIKKAYKTYLDLKSIPTAAGAKDLFDILNDYCVKYHADTHNFSKIKKTFYVESYSPNKTERYICGTVKTGEYGYELDSYDVNEKKRILKARRKEYSEEYPFFFIFVCPSFKIKDMGLLVLQYFGNLGIKTIFEKVLQEFLKNINSELILEINPIISSELFSQLDSADKILKLSISRKRVPKDIAEKVEIDNYEDITEERIFKAKRNKSINLREKAKKLFKDFSSPFIEIKDEKYKEIKLVIKKGNSQKTIRIKDSPEFRESMPLDKGSLNLVGGFPAEDSLCELGIEYANYILEKYGEDLIKSQGEDKWT